MGNEQLEKTCLLNWNDEDKKVTNADEEVSAEPANEDLKRKSTAKKIFVLVILAFPRFAENFCGNLPTPFFSRVVEDKGGNVFHAALSSQIRMLTLVILCPILGHFQTRIGIKKLLYTGLACSALIQALFGALEYVNDYAWFISGAIITRLLYGAAKAAVVVSVSSIACLEYPDRISMVIGWLQAVATFGFVLSSALGGLLYETFGMAIPVIGSTVVILLSMLVSCLLPGDYIYVAEPSCDTFSFRQFFSQPLVMATLATGLSISGIKAYSNVAFTLYFKTLGISATMAGVVLMIWSGSFAVFAIVAGQFINKNAYLKQYAISVGAILSSGVLFFFTPDQSLVVLCVCAFFLGIFCSLSNLPCLEEVLVITNKGPVDKQSSPRLCSTVTGIWIAASSLGQLIPPILASLVQQLTSSTFTAVFYGVSVVNLIIAFTQLGLSLFF